jgi:hypothetical protein
LVYQAHYRVENVNLYKEDVLSVEHGIGHYLWKLRKAEEEIANKFFD